MSFSTVIISPQMHLTGEVMQVSQVGWHQHFGWESLPSFSVRAQHVLVSSDSSLDKIVVNDQEFEKEPCDRLRTYLDYV